jgi:hypothetical protein
MLVPATALAGFRVSSHHQAGKTSEYDAASAIDDSAATAWQIDRESEQVGEWIEIDLPKSQVDKIAMMVGWEKSEESWSDFGRIQEVRLELYSDSDEGMKVVLQKTLTFEDKKGMQFIDVEDTQVGSDLYGGKARLTITKITPGNDYPSVAVSEVRIMLKEIDAATSFTGGGEPTFAEGKGPELMIDGNARTFWVSEDPNPQFTIQASGFGVSSLIVTSGAKPYARPKTLEITCADQVRIHKLQDTNKPQVVPLPSIVGYTGSAWGDVKIVVKDTFAGTKPNVAIAELQLKATNYDGF